MPDHAKLQLAGDIGFLSLGAGYEVFHPRVHADLFYGYVPASIGGDDIHALTAKLSYAPWRSGLGGGWHLQPFRAGLQVTYTFGSQYFVWLPSRYPANYYDVSTALRAGLALGSEVVRALPRGREVGLYAELVALDTMLYEWFLNPRELGPEDVFSLAIGLRVRI